MRLVSQEYQAQVEAEAEAAAAAAAACVEAFSFRMIALEQLRESVSRLPHR